MKDAQAHLLQLAESKLEELRALLLAFARLRDDDELPVELEDELEDVRTYLREG